MLLPTSLATDSDLHDLGTGALGRAMGHANHISFFTLLTNALLAGVIAPIVTASLVTLAATALCFVLAGSALWGWHLVVRRRLLDRAEPTGGAAAEPVDGTR